MNAKDTVMKNKKLALLTNQWEADLPTCDLAHYLIQAQADISFKAGIKEVTQWAKYVGLKNNDPLGRLLIGGREWQAKLKEWELQ